MRDSRLVTPQTIRQTLDLSIDEMAQVMGVHRQTWLKWERGERRPDNAAVRLMEILSFLHKEHPNIFKNILDTS